MLAASIIIDKNIDNSVDISNIQAKKEKIEKEDFLSSITSDEFTKYDGLGVIGVNATHLSASQLGSYAKCPLKYLYINKLRIKTPREDEDGFDVAQMGTIMHSCFESFAKKVQGNKNIEIEAFKSIMLETLEEEYKSFINNPENEIKEENILHVLYKYTLARGLKDDKNDGLLIKFINYYEKNKEELNYFINSEFEKEFALDNELKPYKLTDENDKNYFIKGYIDRFDNLENQVNIIDYKSKKADSVLKNKLEEIEKFRDFQLGLYVLYAKQSFKKVVDSYLLTFNTKNDSTKFARLSTDEELKPKEDNKTKLKGVYYDDKYEADLKSNIFKIKEKIEQGDFTFDSSAEKYCGYCEIKNMCNKSLLNKEIRNESK
jgi:ATP-dependent exoDNAse (exonuclease V) beta subunit